MLTPLEPEPVPKIDSEFLEAGRRAAQAHARALADAKPRRRISNRLLVVGTLAIATLLICAALTLGRANYAGAAPAEGTARRVTAMTPQEKLTARADSGDVHAESALALAYLRGDGVAKDQAAAARWAECGGASGDPAAQYLGDRQPQPFRWPPASRASPAAKLCLVPARPPRPETVKAMHNLAIAYIEGLGTPTGMMWRRRPGSPRRRRVSYVDSPPFDLAVLYEKAARAWRKGSARGAALVPGGGGGGRSSGGGAGRHPGGACASVSRAATDLK